MFVTVSSKPWLLKLDFATIAIKYYHIIVFFQLESRFEILYGIIKIPPSENTSSVQFRSGKSVAISRRKTIIFKCCSSPPPGHPWKLPIII